MDDGQDRPHEDSKTDPAPRRGPLARALFAAAGWVFVGLAAAGVVLPLLPTTPFLILAAACFTRASPRLEHWLITHPRFGPVLTAWRERGAIPRRAKVLAVIALAASYGIFWTVTDPIPATAVIMAVAMIGIGTFIVTRPD
ncbi:MAG: YbaN family protein [Alphaproteobacteria bacterium]